MVMVRSSWLPAAILLVLGGEVAKCKS